MKRLLFLLVCTSFSLAAQELKFVSSLPLEATNFIGIDAYSNTYYIAENVLHKKGADGDFVSTWEDATGNSHDATQTGAARPTYRDNGADNWNGKPVVRYGDSPGQYLGIANHSDLNIGGPYDKKSIIVAFRTGTDITTRQVLYEQGGTVRGLNIYLEDDSPVAVN